MEDRSSGQVAQPLVLSGAVGRSSIGRLRVGLWKFFRSAVK